QTTSITETYGPNEGHAVLIGHDFGVINGGPPEIPPGHIIGNSAALAPWVHRGYFNRPVRVLAWQPTGVDFTLDPALTERQNVLAAINAAIKNGFNESTSLTEFTDPAQLATLLPGQDVLLVYDEDSANNLCGVADIWRADGAPLIPFLNAGGVIIVLNGTFENSQAATIVSRTDTLLTCLDNTVQPLFGLAAPEVFQAYFSQTGTIPVPLIQTIYPGSPNYLVTRAPTAAGGVVLEYDLPPGGVVESLSLIQGSSWSSLDGSDFQTDPIGIT